MATDENVNNPHTRTEYESDCIHFQHFKMHKHVQESKVHGRFLQPRLAAIQKPTTIGQIHTERRPAAQARDASDASDLEQRLAVSSLSRRGKTIPNLGSRYLFYSFRFGDHSQFLKCFALFLSFVSLTSGDHLEFSAVDF